MVFPLIAEQIHRLVYGESEVQVGNSKKGHFVPRFVSDHIHTLSQLQACTAKKRVIFEPDKCYNFFLEDILMKTRIMVILALFVCLAFVSCPGNDDDDNDIADDDVGNDDAVDDDVVDDDIVDDDVVDDDIVDDDVVDDDIVDDDVVDDDVVDDDVVDDDVVDDDTGDDDTVPFERLVWTFVPSHGPDNVQCVGWIDDVNDDGTPDILAHAYDSFLTPDEGDSTFCISGASSGKADLIWGAHPRNDHPQYPSDSGGDGDFMLSASDDVNGDGIQDVLIGTVWGNRSAYALDGTNGDKIWMFCTYTNPASPESGWVYQIIPFRDVTGDGKPETLFGAGSDNNSGWLVNGATGDVVWHMNQSSDAVFGAAMIEDINDDGYPEAILAAGDNEDHVYCVDGDSGTGTVLWSKDTGGNNFCVASIDDLNSDGYQDVLAGSWDANGVVAVSGKTSAILWTSTAYIWPIRIVALDDVNDDNVPDLAATGVFSNQVYVINGVNGQTIWSTGGPAADSVWAVDPLADITGDGVSDVIAGSFDSLVMAFDGTDGTLLWSYDTGAAKVMSVRGTPDITGDGAPDVVAGTQCLSTTTPGAGRIFLLEGRIE